MNNVSKWQKWITKQSVNLSKKKQTNENTKIFPSDIIASMTVKEVSV